MTDVVLWNYWQLLAYEYTKYWRDGIYLAKPIDRRRSPYSSEGFSEMFKIKTSGHMSIETQTKDLVIKINKIYCVSFSVSLVGWFSPITRLSADAIYRTSSFHCHISWCNYSRASVNETT